MVSPRHLARYGSCRADEGFHLVLRQLLTSLSCQKAHRVHITNHATEMSKPQTVFFSNEPSAKSTHFVAHCPPPTDQVSRTQSQVCKDCCLHSRQGHFQRGRTPAPPPAKRFHLPSCKRRLVCTEFLSLNVIFFPIKFGLLAVEHLEKSLWLENLFPQASVQHCFRRVMNLQNRTSAEHAVGEQFPVPGTNSPEPWTRGPLQIKTPTFFPTSQMMYTTHNVAHLTAFTKVSPI